MFKFFMLLLAPVFAARPNADLSEVLEAKATKPKPISEDRAIPDPLVEVLSFRENSAFWLMTTRALADHLIKHDESASGGGAANASLLQRGEGRLELSAELRAELAREHSTVRRVVEEFTGRGTSADAPPMLTTWEGRMQCARKQFSLGNALLVQEDKSYTASEKDDLLANKLAETGASGESQLVTTVKDVWAQVSTSFRSSLSFFLDFLRWELQLPISIMPIPGIGFKCQPIKKCAQEILHSVKMFMKFIGQLVWGIGRIMKALLKPLAKFLGLTGTGLHIFNRHAEDPQDAEGATVEERIHLKGHDGMPPEIDAVDEFVEMYSEQIFDHTSQSESACKSCNTRLKGLISVQPADVVVAGLTGGLDGVFKMFLSTTPQPMTQLTCFDCLWAIKQDFVGLFNDQKDKKNIETYFGPGTCNAHTLGMCMMLQKVESCKLKVQESGMVKTTSQQEARARQMRFCDLFRGTTLRLTKVDGQITCADLHREDLAKARHTNIGSVDFNEDSITKMSLSEGCNSVRRVMKYYTLRCVDHKTAYDAKVTDIQGATTVQQAAQKCRVLFGCGDGSAPEQQEEVTSRNSVDWVALQGKLHSLIRRVDAFQEEIPGAYSPTEASSMLSQLLDRTTAVIESFQSDVASKAELLKNGAPVGPHSDKWGRDLEKVFADPLWDDRCFSGLSVNVDGRYAERECTATSCLLPGSARKMVQVPQNDRLNNLYVDISPKIGDDKFRFFLGLSQRIGVRHWAEGDRHCRVYEPSLAEAPAWVLRAPPTIKSGPVLELLVPIDLARWSQQWEGGYVQFSLHGCKGFDNCLEVAAFDCQGKDYCVGSKAWVVTRCSGPAPCRSRHAGAIVRSITLAASSGEAVEAFKKGSLSFLQSMSEVKEVSRPSRQIAGVHEALSLLKSDPTLQAHETMKQLKKLVDGSETLQELFEDKGWQFVKTSQGLTLELHDGVLTHDRQLKRVTSALEESTRTDFHKVHASIHQLGFDLLKGTAPTPIYGAESGSANPWQPFQRYADQWQKLGGGLGKLSVEIVPPDEHFEEEQAEAARNNFLARRAAEVRQALKWHVPADPFAFVPHPAAPNNAPQAPHNVPHRQYFPAEPDRRPW